MKSDYILFFLGLQFYFLHLDPFAKWIKIHFEFTFVSYGVRCGLSCFCFFLLFFHMYIQYFQHHLLKKPFFSLNYLSLLSKINLPRCDSALFHWPVCLFDPNTTWFLSLQLHTRKFKDFKYLEVNQCKSSNFTLCQCNFLAFPLSLFFHGILKISLSISTKKLLEF